MPDRHGRVDVDVGRPLVRPRKGLVKDVLGRAACRDGELWIQPRSKRGRPEVRRIDHPQGPPPTSGLRRRPTQRRLGLLRTINADDDRAPGGRCVHARSPPLPMASGRQDRSTSERTARRRSSERDATR
jgi:hypothetical protein